MRSPVGIRHEMRKRPRLLTAGEKEWLVALASCAIPDNAQYFERSLAIFAGWIQGVPLKTIGAAHQLSSTRVMQIASYILNKIEYECSTSIKNLRPHRDRSVA